MNFENETFTVIDDEGNEIVCDILFTFESEQFNKCYVIYTDNSRDADGNVIVHASNYSDDSDALMPIETDEEWDLIAQVMDDIQGSIQDMPDEVAMDEDQYEAFIQNMITEIEAKHE